MSDTGESSNGKPKWTPPYASFTTLTNMIERMQKEGGVPSRIDRSYLSYLAGSVRATFMATLKSLNLVTDDMTPTDELIALIDTEDEDKRKELIGAIIKRHYAAALALSAMATQQQLEETFRAQGVTGSTLRKAIAFFLAAAKYADIKYSPHFKLPASPPSAGPKRQKANPGPVKWGPKVTEADELPDDGRRELSGHHPLIAGLIAELPAPGNPFPADDQEAWFEIARATFRLIYKAKPSGSSPRKEAAPDQPAPSPAEADIG